MNKINSDLNDIRNMRREFTHSVPAAGMESEYLEKASDLKELDDELSFVLEKTENPERDARIRKIKNGYEEIVK